MLHGITGSTACRSRRRTALLLSAAFNIAAVGEAQAQAIHEDNGPGDVTYTVDSISGALPAVLISSPDGSVSANIGSVSATAAAGDTGNVVSASTPSANAINVSIGSLGASGSTDATGLFTSAGSGLTSIDVGSIDMSGRRGIAAASQGDVSIVAGTVRVVGAAGAANIDAIAAGREELPGGGRADIGGSLTVDAGSVEARGGENAYAIHADVAGNASIKVGAVLSDGEGVDIAAGGNVDITLNGDVTVAGGAVSTSGDAVTVTVAEGATVTAGGGAIEAEDSGTVAIYNHGTVISTGANGETGQAAILATAQGAVSVVSNIAESHSDVTEFDDENATIKAISTNGPVTITAGTTTTTGGSTYGVWGHSDTGDVTISTGTTISAPTELTGYYTAEAVVGSSGSGNVSITSDYTEANGEYASAIVGITGGTGNVTIVSGTAKTVSGGVIFGIVNGNGGDVSITTTGDTTTVSDGAIVGRARNVSVTTGQGTLTSSNGSTGRAVQIQATGDAVMNNGGTLAASGSNQTAQVIASGAVSITSANAINSGTGAAITASGGRGVFIDADTVQVANSAGVAVSGIATGGDSVMTLGSVSGASVGPMVLAQAPNGAVSITADTVLNSGTSPSSMGIQGIARNGVTMVVGDVEAQSYALRAITATFDAQGNPIIPLNDGHVSIETTGAVTSRTLNAISISGFAHSFDVLVGEDSVVTGNGGSAAIAGGARVGDINVVNNGLVVAQGSSETGIGVTATGAGNVTVVSNEIRVDSDGPISGIYSAGAISAVATGGDVTVNSGLATVSGVDRFGIAARTIGDGDVSVTSVSLSKDADGKAGIQALSESGAISVNSTTLRNAGLDANGIEAISSNGGAITIVSGSLVNSAAGGNENGLANGILAQTSGTVSVASTSITAAGANAYGIIAIGFEGVDVSSGAITAQGVGVVADSAAVTSVLVDGAIAARQGVIATGATLAVNVAAGGSIVAQTSGIVSDNTGTGTATIVNEGSVNGGSDAAILAYGRTTLTNAGTLTAGTSGIAALLDGTDDTVILRSGSAITGVIDTGAGFDTVRLDGANGGTLASFANAEALSVDTGRWTTGTSANWFDTVAIASGAELQVNLAADGSSGIETGQATVDGTLTLNYTDTSEAGDITGVAIGGTGTLRLIGAGELVLGGNDLTLTGTTRVENGTLSLTGTLASDVVTTGAGVFRITDGSNFTGDLRNDGTFVYDRSDSYTIAGDFSGSGLMVKNGSGTLTFGGLYAFTGVTTVNGGKVTFTGQLAENTVLDLQQGTVDLSNALNGQQTIAELAGSSAGSLALGATDLTVNQSTDSAFAGSITGTGGLTKTGSGTLNLTGTSTYSGNTEVSGGTLKVNGALPNSTVIVDQGGTLGGNGTIGGLAMNGGNLAPGNSIGRLQVNGNIAFTANSTYVVEANAAGQADRIDATGTATLGGARVQVLAQTGRYRGRTSYTILTAQGGVSGTFSSVSSNFAFLTPSLAYDATSVTLNLTRNDADFASLATTANGRAVGGALQALGAGNALFEETLFLQDSQVQPNFASLSGEIYPSLSSGLIEDAQMLRRSVIGQPVREDQGAFGWATLLGSWGKADATANAARLHSDQKGILGGIGFAGNGLNASIGVGRIAANYRGNGHADVDSTVVTGAVRYAAGGFTGTVGATYAWHDIDTARSAALGALSNALKGKADGSTRQVFGEVGFGIDTGSLALTPFAGLSYVETRRDALSESGGELALALSSDKRHATFGTLGLRVAGKPANGERLSIAPYGSAAWRRAWGDRDAVMQAGIGGTAGGFTVVGTPIAKDAAELAAGVTGSVGPMRVSLGYEGLVASDWQNHSAQLKFSIAF